ILERAELRRLPRLLKVAEVEKLLCEWKYKSLFPGGGVRTRSGQKMEETVPFPALHSVHGGFNVIVVTVDLFFKVFLPFCEVFECVIHILDLLLALHAFTMFTANITRNSVK